MSPVGRTDSKSSDMGPRDGKRDPVKQIRTVQETIVESPHTNSEQGFDKAPRRGMG